MRMKRRLGNFLGCLALALAFALSQSCLLFALQPDIWSKREAPLNDSMERAAEISLNSTLTIHSGHESLSPENGGVRWYKFKLVKPGHFNAELKFSSDDSSSEGLRMHVCDSLGKGIDGNFDFYFNDSSESNPEPGVLISSEYGVEPGTYYIEVIWVASSSNVSYSLRVNFTPDEFWERENNNSAETANGIIMDQAIGGALSSSSDEDWFRFLSERPCVVRLEFDHEIVDSPSVFWRIRLFDVTGVKELMNAQVRGDRESYTSESISLPEGTHYIKVERGALVERGAFSSSAYSLRVSVQDWH